jgi:hypothetical protein
LSPADPTSSSLSWEVPDTHPSREKDEREAKMGQIVRSRRPGESAGARDTESAPSALDKGPLTDGCLVIP